MKYVLSCCSTCDLTKEHLLRRNISYICFHYTLGGVSYQDDLGETMALSDFYRAMDEGADTSTSQINPDEFISYFEPFLQEGRDVLHLCLSSGISGVYGSAMVARDELAERYPDRKIYVVDSLCASSGLGMMMDKLADMRDAGKGIDELYEFAQTNRLKVHHWFIASDLTHLVKGGRVSKVAGFMGTALKICPLLNVSVNGELIPRQKIRTKKKALAALVDKMVENCDNGLDYNDTCYICNSNVPEDAQYVQGLVEERFPQLKGRVQIYDIGTVIGCHTGTGVVAVFFWGKERAD